MDPETPPGARAHDEEEAQGAERRQWPRRTLPFGRGAVLEVAGQNHVVGLHDLSEGGALLLTRAQAVAGDAVLLKLSLVSGRAEVSVPATVVRVVDSPSGGPQKGLALRFVDLDEGVRAAIAAFVARAPRRRQA